jgi:hypothetical protein
MKEQSLVLVTLDYSPSLIWLDPIFFVGIRNENMPVND